MKKVLSILLSAMLIISTMTVLMLLPAVATTATEPVNLLFNGDAEGGQYTSADIANETYEGEYVVNNALGWRTNQDSLDTGVRYGNFPVVGEGEGDNRGTAPEGLDYGITYSNYSGEVFSLNVWGQTAMQDVTLKAGKTYKVSAKVAVMPVEKDLWYGVVPFDFFFDEKVGTITKPTLPSNKNYQLAKGDMLTVLNAECDRSKFANWEQVTNKAGTKTYTKQKDFTEYAFIFKADDFLADHTSITPEADGSFKARFCIYNPLGTLIYLDDISIYEVCAISADKGGVVNTDAAYTGAVNTLVATPDYGNTFAGWYDEDGLVSTAATYTGVVDKDIVAKFNVINQIVGGDFETNGAAAVAQFAGTKGSGANGNNTVVASPTLGTDANANHGDKALYCVPLSAANTARYLIPVTVTVEPNKDYVFHYSYYTTDEKLTEMHFATAPVQGFTGAWNNTAILGDWTLAWKQEKATAYGTWPVKMGPAGTTFNNDTRTGWNWPVGYQNNWVDVWFRFNSGDDATLFTEGANYGKLYFFIGGMNSQITPFYLDNMSFTEAVATRNTDIKAVAGEGGSVAVAQKQTIVTEILQKYNADNVPIAGENGSYATVIAGTQKYSNIATTTYTATANAGYVFKKWVDESGNTVSTDATASLYTPGTYTAVFALPVAAGEGGTLVENEDGTVTAKAYYGNAFDGWYDGDDKLTGGEYDTATVTAEGNEGVVAKFIQYNVIDNGNFDYDADPFDYASSSCFGEIKTEANGNRYMQVTSVKNFTGVRIPFTLEQGKRYVISYKWRESSDENGVSLSPATSFRKNIRLTNGKGSYLWEKLIFANESSYYRSGTRVSTSGTNYNPLGAGTYLNIENPGPTSDCWQRYSYSIKDWMYETVVVDTTNVSYGETVVLSEEGDSNLFAICFGDNNAVAPQVLDIDDIVVGEVDGVNWFSVTGGGNVYPMNPVTIATTDTVYNATLPEGSLYEFKGWYDNDTLLSTETSYTVTEAGSHTLKALFEIPKVDVNEEGSGDFEGDLDPSQVADKNKDTTLKMVDYTEDQKALAGYNAEIMGNSALKVTSASNSAHLDVSFPVEITAGGKYLGHLKFLVESSTANDPKNEEAKLEDSSRFDIQFSSKPGSWSQVDNAGGTISISNALGNAVSGTAKESLYVSCWFGYTNKNRYNNDFVDAYYYIDAANLESGTYYLSLGMRNGGVFYVDNVSFVDVETMAPTMIGATMNTNVADGDEIMYVTRVNVPYYVGINKVATYMAPTTKLAKDYPERVSNFADDLGDEYVATATLEAYPNLNMITYDTVPFKSGDLYSAFVGASKVTQTNKYSARSVISLTDANGNELGITLATGNTAAENKIENGVYTRSIAQVKRLNAKFAIENGYADLAARVITEGIEGKALYNGAIAQVWDFAKQAAALMANAAN